MGDYCSGTNHVLPTYGFARAYSGLSLIDFMKRITVQELTRGWSARPRPDGHDHRRTRRTGCPCERRPIRLAHLDSGSLA